MSTKTRASLSNVRSAQRSSTTADLSSMALRPIFLVLLLLLLHPGGTHGFRSISPHGRNRLAISTKDVEPTAVRLSPAIPISTTTTTTTSPSKVPSTSLAASAGSLLSNTDTWVFVAGIFPFLWATYEFWRRIMFGESFGTGTDRVIIGMDDSPQDSRGTRVLGKGALATAYFLFVCAFGTLALIGYSVATSEAPSDEALAAASAAAAAVGDAPAAP